jgi:hypothetical protein
MEVPKAVNTGVLILAGVVIFVFVGILLHGC